MGVGKVLNRSWHIIATYPGPVFGYGFLALLIVGLSFGLLLGPMYTGYCGLILKLERGESAGFEELFGYFGLQHWFGGILYGLALAAPFLVGVVFGLAWLASLLGDPQAEPSAEQLVSGVLGGLFLFLAALIVTAWLMTRWLLLFPVLVFHQGGTREAFGIAVEILRQKGGFGPALGLVLIAYAIGMVFSALMSALGLPFISLLTTIPWLVFMVAAYLETRQVP